MSITISIDRSKTDKKYHFGSGTYTVQQNGVNAFGAMDYSDTSKLYDVMELLIEDHPDLIKAILNNSRSEIVDYLLANDFDDAYQNAHIVLNLQVSKASLESMIVGIGKGDPQTIMKNPLKVAQLLQKYHIGDGAKPVPYTNYETNDGDENCVVRYLSQTYTKISDKSINNFFKKECTLGTVLNFIDKYNLSARIINIDGKLILERKSTSIKHYPIFIAMIANHHIYPLVKGKSIQINHTPKLPTNETTNITDNSIKCINNNTVYIKDGIVHEDYQPMLDQCDNIAFRVYPSHNFTYPRSPKCQALYRPATEVQTTFAYDMKACYANLFFKDIPADFEYGIWCCFDTWQKYDQSEIRPESYYLLDNKDLTKYGIVTNFHIGFFVQLLLDHKIIHYHNIEGVNKPYFKTTFSKMRDKTIEYLTECATTTGLVDVTKLEEFKRLRVYNGLLGRTRNTKCKKFTPLPPDDIHLLNLKCNDLLNPDKVIDGDWQYFPTDDRLGQVVRRRSTHRNLNHVNIYNLIVEYANYEMLKRILSIKEIPIAIKTDCLFYTRRQSELDKDDRFKLEDGHLPMHIISTQYHKYEEINANIFKLFENNKNITYYGPPGTGKTYIVKHNEKYDYCATISNMCRLNMRSEDSASEPQTLFSLFKCYNPSMWIDAIYKLKNKTLWIDEFSMCSRMLWNFIVISTTQYNTRLILSGDINQIGPIGESKLDLDNPIVRLLFGLQTELKQDYRNQPNLIKFRDAVLNDKDIDLYGKLKRIYNHTEDWLKLDRHLTYRHAIKDQVNAAILKERGYRWEYILDKTKRYYVEPSVGVIVIAISNKKDLGIAKSDVWKIIAVSDKDVEMRNLSRGDRFIISKHILAEYFRLGFCTTIHASQGLTIEDKFAIHNASELVKDDSRCILYTGITRGKDLDHIMLLSSGRKYAATPIKYPVIKVDKDEEDIFADMRLTVNK